MRCYTLFYESILSFHLLPKEEIGRASTILIQIYATYRSSRLLQKIADEALLFFPRATLVGLACDATITGGGSKEMTLVTIHTFEESTLRATCIPFPSRKAPYSLGQRTAEKLLHDQSRLFLLYGVGSPLEVESFCRGFSSRCKEVPTAGLCTLPTPAFAAPYLHFQQNTYDKGVVVLALEGTSLRADVGIHYGTEPIGPSFEITAVTEETIHQINRRPAQHFLRHYLGETYLQHLVEASKAIPLMEQQTPQAHRILATASNGSIRCSTLPRPGSRWRFATATPEHPAPFREPSLGPDVLPEGYLLLGSSAWLRHNRGQIWRLGDFYSQEAPLCGAFSTTQWFSRGQESVWSSHSLLLVALSETVRSTAAAAEKKAFRWLEEPHPDDSLTGRILTHLGMAMAEETRLVDAAFRRLMEESEHGVVLLDSGYRLLYANTQASEWLGLSMSGKNKEAELPDWIDEFVRQMPSEGGGIRAGYTLDAASGRRIGIEIEALPLQNEQKNKPSGILLLVRRLADG